MIKNQFFYEFVHFYNWHAKETKKIKIMQQRKKRLGVGATVAVLKRFLHPSKRISKTHINYVVTDKLENLLALRKELKKI